MSSSITFKGYELIGDLIPNQPLGVFVIGSTHESIITISDPYFALAKYESLPIYHDDDLKKEYSLGASMDLILTISPEYRLDLLRLSLVTIRDQAHYYEEYQFEHFLKELSPKTPELHELGSIQMKNEAKRFKAICSKLLIALDAGEDLFYQEYLALIYRLNPDSTFSVSQAQFMEHSVKQHYLKYKDEQSNDVKWPTPHLYATWLKPILEAMWLGDIIHRAYKDPKIQHNVNEMFLDLAHIEFVPTLVEQKSKQDRIWFDFDSGGITAGLSPKVVEKVLAQHNQGIIIDLLKLFTTLWNEHPDIQRTRCFNIPNRWNGLAELLHDRYGLSINGKNTQNIINSCRLLEALRWGTSWQDHSKLLAFGGRKRNEQLIVSYMEGFWQPLTDHERLIPILNHPKGIGRSRPFYNRFGLAIGSWLVQNSHAYYDSGGLGVQLDDEAYQYFQNRVGFSRKSDVDKAIDVFMKHDAVVKVDGLLGLGHVNDDGAKLILEGAKKSIAGRRGGLESQKRNRDKLKLGKK